jgi:hypothetical protein
MRIEPLKIPGENDPVILLLYHLDDTVIIH